MKVTLKWILKWTLLYSATCDQLEAGDFVNLGFSDVDVSKFTDGKYYPTKTMIPGWTVTGGDGAEVKEIRYLADGWPFGFAIDSRPNGLGGHLSLCGLGCRAIPFSLSQRATIPTNAVELRYNWSTGQVSTNESSPFSKFIQIDGVPLSVFHLVIMETGLSFGVNVQKYAGKEVTLSFNFPSYFPSIFSIQGFSARSTLNDLLLRPQNFDFPNLGWLLVWPGARSDWVPGMITDFNGDLNWRRASGKASDDSGDIVFFYLDRIPNKSTIFRLFPPGTFPEAAPAGLISSQSQKH